MTTPIKVLLVTDYGTPTGGDEILTLELRDGLRTRGHDARLFTTNARPLPVPVESDYTCFGTTSRWRSLLQSANPFAAVALRRVLVQFDPDVIHLRSFLTQLSPLILPMLRDRPSIAHLDTLRAICPSGSKLLPNARECNVQRGRVCLHDGCLSPHDWLTFSAQMRASDRLLNDIFTLRITNSAHMLARLRLGGIHIDEYLWNGTRIPVQPAVRDARPTVAYAGRLVREKGVAIFLRAAARVLGNRPDTAVIIAGDGPDRVSLEKLARQLGIATRVVFTGHLAREELEHHIGGAWIQVVPSLWPEPFGLVTIEAMARGTAVVATAIGGSVELITDGDNGLLVPPGDEAALARALAGLIDSPERADEIARRGRRFATLHTSIDTFVDGVERLYDRVLGARGGPSPHANGAAANPPGEP